jgi:hypothetical protein
VPIGDRKDHSPFLMTLSIEGMVVQSAYGREREVSKRLVEEITPP